MSSTFAAAELKAKKKMKKVITKLRRQAISRASSSVEDHILNHRHHIRRSLDLQGKNGRVTVGKRGFIAPVHHSHVLSDLLAHHSKPRQHQIVHSSDRKKKPTSFTATGRQEPEEGDNPLSTTYTMVEDMMYCRS